MSGGHSVVAPPGSIPNPEVKHTSADGSVGLPHVRVGHRQTSNKQSLVRKHGGFFYACSPDARRHRPRTSRIVRDNPHRPVRRMRTLPPRAYVAHCARQSISPRAPKAHATTAPRTSRIVRDNPHRAVRPMRTLPPHHVRRALCATIHIAPCAEGARYRSML